MATLHPPFSWPTPSSRRPLPLFSLATPFLSHLFSVHPFLPLSAQYFSCSPPSSPHPLETSVFLPCPVLLHPFLTPLIASLQFPVSVSFSFLDSPTRLGESQPVLSPGRAHRRRSPGLPFPRSCNPFPVGSTPTNGTKVERVLVRMHARPSPVAPRHPRAALRFPVI